MIKRIINCRPILFAILFSGSFLFSSCGGTKPREENEINNTASVPATDTNESISGKMLKPCHWMYRVEQSGSEAILVATTKIDAGWHLYSQKIANEQLAMLFDFEASPDYKLVGNTEEDKPHKEYDKYLQLDILYFENEATFRQKIKISGKNNFTIKGTIDYTVCQTQCVPSAEEFSFNVKGNPQAD